MALPASLFETVPNLSQLRLDNNKLSVLSSRLFHPLTRLIVFNLSKNQISSFQSEMFSDLTNLQTLDISANTINRLSTGKNSIYKRVFAETPLTIHTIR